MTEDAAARLTRTFKLAALQRMLAGENVSALARELGIKRKLLYQWRNRFRSEGPAGLRSRGRPRRDLAESTVLPAGLVAPAAAARGSPLAPGRSPRVSASAEDGRSAAAVAAEARVAALERKVGQQELELDFFREALRRLKDVRSSNGTPAAPRSTRSSGT
jgi:transposase